MWRTEKLHLIKQWKPLNLFIKRLIEIEKKSGVDAAEEYLKGYFEAKETTYDEFIDDITGNKGIFKLFFKTMKKIFG